MTLILDLHQAPRNASPAPAGPHPEPQPELRPVLRVAASRDLRPRVAVVVQRLGIGSEVWIERQMAGFEGIVPVLVGWSAEPGWTPPPGLEVRYVPGPFAAPRSRARRLLRRLGMPGALAQDAGQRRALADTLRAAGVEAVLSHFAWTAMAVAEALAATPDLAGLPHVWHVHGRDVSAQLRDPATRARMARVLPRASAVVAVGRHQLAALGPLGTPARTALIPCGAPFALFGAGPLPAQPDRRVGFLSVGRICAEKGMAETLQAFLAVADDLPQATLTLIGDGPDLAALRARAAASPHAGRIRLTGALPPAEVAREMAAAQVYLQHSREIGGWVEGFGVTLAEAGATGLPLLAAASGGLVDQIEEGVNGHLFPPGDWRAEAALMRRLADDPDLRTAMGARARELARRFDAAAMTAALEAVLRAALAPAAQRRPHRHPALFPTLPPTLRGLPGRAESRNRVA